MKDFFFYKGSIERMTDLRFVHQVAEHNDSSKAKECVIVMASGGGNPDAAYKMGRYLQHRYDSYSVLVAGFCKSAATLFAIGAKELIFCPFGELGPLDIQQHKADNPFGLESGLNIGEAFTTLEKQSRQTFNDMLMEIIQNSGGVITFKTASEVATGMVSALYSPIFSQIEPEEVGSRSRAMRIGEDYAKRLNRYGNLKPGALEMLSHRYTSHSFVIDYVEAKLLFNNVRLVNDQEAKLVADLGDECRYPTGTTEFKPITLPEIQTEKVNITKPSEKKAATNAKTSKPKEKPATKRGSRSRSNGKDSARAG